MIPNLADLNGKLNTLFTPPTESKTMEVPYALKALKRNWSNPHWWPVVFNSQVVGRFHSVTRDRDGVHIPDEDWDNLLILDGCRYDLFERYYQEIGLDGTLEKKVSKGSGSPEFLRRNFGGGNFDDIVYVTANPFVEKVIDDPFFHTEHVWLDGWNEEEETVLAETLVDRTWSLLEEYPNKRFVMHFMQPHHPFVGQTRLEDDPGFVGAIAKSTDEEVPDVEFVWEKLRKNQLSKDDVWEAYADNLNYVMDSVRPFLEEVDGKSIVTSDHGNAFGERARPFPSRVYGHGNRIRIPALIDVPWYVPEYESRREITEGEESDRSVGSTEDIDIEEKLTALGYK